MQVLLGIAAGAWLLTPKWLAASATARQWLDEHDYEAEVSICALMCCNIVAAPEVTTLSLFLWRRLQWYESMCYTKIYQVGNIRINIMLAQTPFAAAAARAREHAARSGAPLLAGKAVHILRSAEAGSQGASTAEALTRAALAHGAKVGKLVLVLPASFCHMRGKPCNYHKLT